MSAVEAAVAALVREELRRQLPLIVREELDRLGLANRPVASTSPYLSVPEAAVYLRCRPQHVYDLRSQRRLTPHKDGSGRALCLRAEVEQFGTGDHAPGWSERLSAA